MILNGSQGADLNRDQRLAEGLLRELIQAATPVRRVVAIAIHMPDMRHISFLQVGVEALFDVDKAVLVAAGEDEQLELLCWGQGFSSRPEAYPCALPPSTRALEMFAVRLPVFAAC